MLPRAGRPFRAGESPWRSVGARAKPCETPPQADRDGARALTAEFETLTLPLAPVLYRMAYHLTRNQSEAEDLTQETYLRAFRAFSGFRGGNERAWMFAILRNAFRDECRRRGRELMVEPEVAETAVEGLAVVAWAPSAESEALRRLPSEAIEQAFAALPPEWRLIVVLADVEELTYREIASVLGIPMGTVMSRLSRARKRLQEHLLAAPSVGWAAREKSA